MKQKAPRAPSAEGDDDVTPQSNNCKGYDFDKGIETSKSDSACVAVSNQHALPKYILGG